VPPCYRPAELRLGPFAGREAGASPTAAALHAVSRAAALRLGRPLRDKDSTCISLSLSREAGTQKAAAPSNGYVHFEGNAFITYSSIAYAPAAGSCMYVHRASCHVHVRTYVNMHSGA
jgi:hypothetical protein